MSQGGIALHTKNLSLGGTRTNCSGSLRAVFAAVLIATFAALPKISWAVDPGVIAAQSAPAAATLKVSVLHQAAPDECFDFIGSPNNTYPATPPCAVGMPKVNQAYIWGLTSTGKNLWYGTVANTLCTVIAGVESAVGFNPQAFDTDSYVCEFGESNFLNSNPSVPAELGDWRPPKIFSYNIATGQVTDRTPNDPLINQTLGLRSAGSMGDLVIIAGPALAPFGQTPPGINLFAFQDSTGAYLGSKTLPQFSDIRLWTTLTVAARPDPTYLYTGVQNADSTGSILKWTGTVKNPFQFIVVGNLDAEPAYLAAFHGNRLFATTWGGLNSKTGKLTGLWESPQIGANGLKSKNAGQWKKVWNIGQYEADPVTAQSIVGGAVGSYNGSLYWGTMQVPLTGLASHYFVYPPSGIPTAGDVVASIVDTTRPVAIFQCCGVGSKFPKQLGTTLLYGDSLMGVYSPSNGWQTRSNNMNVEPKFGPAGFGNPFNTYDWAMAGYNGKLYVGTFDWSYVLVDLIAQLVPPMAGDPGDLISIVAELSQGFGQNITYGADLWSFSGNGPATAESQFGVGNYLNYGIRTMVATGGSLYLGTANPMNLRTDLNNPPLGGFELLGLHP